MNDVIYVNTGEVKLGDKSAILNSGAIGSCVVVCIYNTLLKTGAMAHIMLPDDAPDGQTEKMRYASNAIHQMIVLLNRNNDSSIKLETCIIGGANVLKRPNETIGKKNIDSVTKLLDKKGIIISEKAVGGFERRTAIFDIGMGEIHYTEGDSNKKNLWKTISNSK